MGATTFATSTSGADATEAFHTAKEQAYYDHGHAGYTGTIAEKPGFFMLTDDPVTIEKAEEMEQLYLNEDPSLPDHIVARVADKWGDAACIPIDDGTFFFFGWASC